MFTLGAAMLGWHRVPTGFVSGHAIRPALSLCKHSKRVPDVNTLIIIVMWILLTSAGIFPTLLEVSVSLELLVDYLLQVDIHLL